MMEFEKACRKTADIAGIRRNRLACRNIIRQHLQGLVIQGLRKHFKRFSLNCDPHLQHVLHAAAVQEGVGAVAYQHVQRFDRSALCIIADKGSVARACLNKAEPLQLRHRKMNGGLGNSCLRRKLPLAGQFFTRLQLAADDHAGNFLDEQLLYRGSFNDTDIHTIPSFVV